MNNEFTMQKRGDKIHSLFPEIHPHLSDADHYYYTAQQAFDWLREHAIDFSLHNYPEENLAAIHIYNNESVIYNNRYATNLANLLWEAVIWIKENER